MQMKSRRTELEKLLIPIVVGVVSFIVGAVVMFLLIAHGQISQHKHDYDHEEF